MRWLLAPIAPAQDGSLGPTGHTPSRSRHFMPVRARSPACTSSLTAVAVIRSHRWCQYTRIVATQLIAASPCWTWAGWWYGFKPAKSLKGLHFTNARNGPLAADLTVLAGRRVTRRVDDLLRTAPRAGQHEASHRCASRNLLTRPSIKTDITEHAAQPLFAGQVVHPLLPLPESPPKVIAWPALQPGPPPDTGRQGQVKAPELKSMSFSGGAPACSG